MTRRYARASRGVRVYETTPEGSWKILTILGAMSLRGMIATMAIEAATDAEILLAYLDHVLCPALRPGDVLVMDNLSSHKVSGVRERIAASGAELLYLPPYSPDLNPIEKALGKAQAAAAHRQSQNRRGAPTSHRRTPSRNQTTRRSSLVQDSLLCSIAMRNTL
jgi:transposase